MKENTENALRSEDSSFCWLIALSHRIILGFYFGFGLNRCNDPGRDQRNSCSATEITPAPLRLSPFSSKRRSFRSPQSTNDFAGLLLFSLLEVFIMTTIGVYLGSIVSFTFGKLFGRKAVEWVLGEKTVNHYLEMAKGREQAAIFLMLLFAQFSGRHSLHHRRHHADELPRFFLVSPPADTDAADGGNGLFRRQDSDIGMVGHSRRNRLHRAVLHLQPHHAEKMGQDLRVFR